MLWGVHVSQSRARAWRESMSETAVRKGEPNTSAWAPFSRKAFTVLWIATVISNIGTWMHDVGAGWLMTELSPSPAIVTLVQAATTLPVFLFALLAGAVADIVDRRKMLLLVNIVMGGLAALFALLVSIDLVTPTVLLIFTFALGTGAAFMAPAWQAIVPKLIPRPELTAAVSLNSMGINISRAIGPALAGALIVAFGIAWPFVINALSVLGIIAALYWWKPAAEKSRRSPPEHIFGAMLAGLTYASYSAPLKQTLIRAAAFFLFASAYWAMLPLIAKNILQGDAELYGILLASVGAGAVIGALVMPTIRAKLGPDWTVAAGAIGTAIVLVIFVIAPGRTFAALAAGIGGVAWIAVLSTLNVSAQTALPDWVRARGLSIFLTVFAGSMTLGSLIWGQIASAASIQMALLIAAAGLMVLVPLTWRYKLSEGNGMDFTPSMHWPEPIIAGDAPHADSAILISITYTVDEDDRDKFLIAMNNLAQARRRLGAHGWALTQDTAERSTFVEVWQESSWLQHMRHHERMSEADRLIQQQVHALHMSATPPLVRHLVILE